VMTEKQQTADFRDFRPATVILFDFVKHSIRPSEEVHVIQNITEHILADTVKTLSLTQYLFTHTGDGWMCILLGDDSARTMDFVNLLFAALGQRLEPFKQNYRAGMDYGLLHLRQSSISKTPSHFETPGILSARLEAVARPQQILCTDTIRAIFFPHYPEMFTSESAPVETKDRIISACEVTPLPLPNVRLLVSDLFFAKADRLAKNLQGTKKLLIVDDEYFLTKTLHMFLGKFLGMDRILTASDGEAALKLFRRDEFSAIITDVMMPYMSGFDLVQRIAAIDPDVPVIFISGYYDPVADKDHPVFDSSVMMAIQKPFSMDQILRSLSFVTAFGTPTNVRSRLRLITDDPTGFLRRIVWIANSVDRIVGIVDDPMDVGHSLLRHKAKRISDEVIRRIVPGGDVVSYLDSAITQLRKISTLSSVARPREKLSLKEHLSNMIEDYTKSNKKVTLSLDCSLVSSPSLVAMQSVALLVTAELVDNALDAVEHKGEILVECRWERANQQLRIEVTDDGPGVPHNMLADLFQSGRSIKGEGRGMGLSLINQACHAFHGMISHSRDDGKTVFVATFRLPEGDMKESLVSG
jgi:DNA-binding response OmpR family regulator/anti-sigma regulatory factor (Ser/Thr protein kinase)